jgi:glycosyltransferase involved in cell wall biosynthesis
MIAYHYSPSNEIGARRPAALAVELNRRGYSIAVVSTFDGQSGYQASGSAGKAEVRIFVPEPRKYILPALVAIRQALRRPSWALRKNKLTKGRNRTQSHARSSPGNQPNLIVRFATFIDTCKLWSFRALIAAQKQISEYPPRLVYCTAPPLSTLLAATWLSWWNGLPLVVDMRDAWITGRANGVPRGCSARLQRFLEAWVYRRAAAVVVTASGLAEHYRLAFPLLSEKIHVIRNGFDGEPNEPREDTQHKLSMLFAGEIYVNRDPFGFLEALERLLSRDDVEASKIKVTFVGRCESYRGASLSEWLNGKRAKSVVEILPPVPLKDVQEMTSVATVMLNFAQRAPSMIPAKSYDQMASGREVLLLCEASGDTGKLFEGRQGVLRVDPAISAEVDVALVDLYKRHVVEGKATVPSVGDVIEFSRAYQTTQYADLIERAIGARVAN